MNKITKNIILYIQIQKSKSQFLLYRIAYHNELIRFLKSYDCTVLLSQL